MVESSSSDTCGVAAFGLIMAVVKGLLTVLVIGLVVIGIVAVIKWAASDKSSTKIGS